MIYSVKCGMQLLIHSQTSTVKPLKFGNGKGPQMSFLNITISRSLPNDDSIRILLYNFTNKFSDGSALLIQFCFLLTNSDLTACLPPPTHNQRKQRWRHQMETFSALLALCAGNSPVTGKFPSQRPVTRSLGVFCDLRLNNELKWRDFFHSMD